MTTRVKTLRVETKSIAIARELRQGWSEQAELQRCSNKCRLLGWCYICVSNSLSYQMTLQAFIYKSKGEIDQVKDKGKSRDQIKQCGCKDSPKAKPISCARGHTADWLKQVCQEKQARQRYWLEMINASWTPSAHGSESGWGKCSESRYSPPMTQ